MQPRSPSIQFTPTAPKLVKLTTPSASELAGKAKLSPQASALAKPGLSASDYLHSLQQHKLPLDAVSGLAHGLPERHAVWWAAKSAEQVSSKLNPQEQAAAKAAETWVKSPTPENKAAAALAATKTDFRGPGGWAAQAAAWSTPPAPPGGTPALPTQPSLTGSAVSGAVLLAAGLSNRPPMQPPQLPNLNVPPITVKAPELAVTPPPQPPAVDQAKLVGPLQPFLDLGNTIASGGGTWA